MNENRHSLTLNARNFLRSCTHIFGIRFMHDLFKVSERTFCMWRSDPRHVSSDSIRENYIEKHEKLLKMLMEEPDGTDIARGIVSTHANITGCEIQIKESTVPNRHTIEEECLDDYPPVIKLHEAIRNKLKPEVIEYLAGEAKRGIEATVIKYKSLTF